MPLDMLKAIATTGTPSWPSSRHYGRIFFCNLSSCSWLKWVQLVFFAESFAAGWCLHISWVAFLSSRFVWLPKFQIKYAKIDELTTSNVFMGGQWWACKCHSISRGQTHSELSIKILRIAGLYIRSVPTPFLRRYFRTAVIQNLHWLNPREGGCTAWAETFWHNFVIFCVLTWLYSRSMFHITWAPVQYDRYMMSDMDLTPNLQTFFEITILTLCVFFGSLVCFKMQDVRLRESIPTGQKTLYAQMKCGKNGVVPTLHILNVGGWSRKVTKNPWTQQGGCVVICFHFFMFSHMGTNTLAHSRVSALAVHRRWLRLWLV